jgi:hypothetical protein
MSEAKRQQAENRKKRVQQGLPPLPVVTEGKDAVHREVLEIHQKVTAQELEIHEIRKVQEQDNIQLTGMLSTLLEQQRLILNILGLQAKMDADDEMLVQLLKDKLGKDTRET